MDGCYKYPEIPLPSMETFAFVTSLVGSLSECCPYGDIMLTIHKNTKLHLTYVLCKEILMYCTFLTHLPTFTAFDDS